MWQGSLKFLDGAKIQFRPFNAEKSYLVTTGEPWRTLSYVFWTLMSKIQVQKAQIALHLTFSSKKSRVSSQYFKPV